MDTSLWQLRWQGSFEAERPSEGYYKPIPAIDVPVLFNSHLVAVLATSYNAPPTYTTAGWVSQQIVSGILTGGRPDANVTQNLKVYLGRIAILQLPKITSSFGLTYFVPRWFFDINLTFWQYADESIVDEYDIKPTLQRIEQKVDDISQFGY
jgi:hypothetical protein